MNNNEEQQLMGTLIVTCDTGKVSDGYHTFDELYEHRCWLFSALASTQQPYAWKSKQHHDGTSYDGWFIAGIDLDSGTITYHLPITMWHAFPGDILEQAPEWDGHTSEIVLERLRVWVGAVDKPRLVCYY